VNIDLWKKAVRLMGRNGELKREQLAQLNLHEGDVFNGWWRAKDKNGKMVPVIIWEENGERKFLAGDRVIAEKWQWEVFKYAVKRPVTQGALDSYEQTGLWPDSPGLPAEGIDPDTGEVKGGVPTASGSDVATTHNSGGNENIFDELTRLWAEKTLGLNKFLETAITEQTRADKAANWVTELADIHRKATEAFKAEKAPILERAKAIDLKWHELQNSAGSARKLIDKVKGHINTYLTALAIANREKADAQRQAAEALKARAADPTATPTERAQADKEARDAEKYAESLDGEKPSAGLTGSKVSQRSVRSAKVEDYKAAALHLIELNHADMLDLIDKLADRALSKGLLLRGAVEIKGTRAQ